MGLDYTITFPVTSLVLFVLQRYWKRVVNYMRGQRIMNLEEKVTKYNVKLTVKRIRDFMKSLTVDEQNLFVKDMVAILKEKGDTFESQRSKVGS
jgi:N-glycosylase/DNA lyase